MAAHPWLFATPGVRRSGVATRDTCLCGPSDDTTHLGIFGTKRAKHREVIKNTEMAPAPDDRIECTNVLVEALKPIVAGTDLLVLGLPHGGIPIADGVARTLQAPLDVLAVWQLEVPGIPELVLGALAGGGVREMNPEVARVIPSELLERIEERGRRHLEEGRRRYRNTRCRPRVRGKQVVLVHDGIGNSTTMRAAIRAARKRGACRVIVATPIASHQAIAEIEPKADAVVCPLRYEGSRSSGSSTPSSAGDPQQGHVN